MAQLTDERVDEFDRRMRRILTTVEYRQREISEILNTVIVNAARNGRFAAFSKVITIVIGAFIATSGAAQILFGEDNLVALVGYTLLGVAIAAVVALSTAFRFDDRSSGLNRLGVDCRTVMLDLHYRYHRNTEGAAAGEERIAAASDMLVEWDRHLAQLRQRAADLGIIVRIDYQPVASQE